MYIKPAMILAISTLLISACSTTVKDGSQPVETPLTSFSKYNQKENKEYVQNKINDMNTWWQQLEEPILMLLIKEAQDNHPDSYSAKASLTKYIKQKKSSPIFLAQWEKNHLNNNTNLKKTSLFWYDLRTSLSAEVSRQFMIYQTNSSQLNLFLDYSKLKKDDSSEATSQLKLNIEESISSLEILTKLSKPEIKKLLLRSFPSAGEKIINNSFPIVSPNLIEVSTLAQRADIHANILNLQKSLFNSTKNKAFPLILLEGNMTTEDKYPSIKIQIKFKDNNQNYELEYGDIKESFNKLENSLDETSQEVIINMQELESINKNLNELFTKQQEQLSNIQKKLIDNQNYSSIQFIKTSMDMISLEEKRINKWIDLYKSLGGGFTVN